VYWQVTLKLSEDGSGIGAALVAAAAHHSRKSASKKQSERTVTGH